MFSPVRFNNRIEPLVCLIEDTIQVNMVEQAGAKMLAGVSPETLLLAAALAVTRSSDLPPHHHGGPVHVVSTVHAISGMCDRLGGTYAGICALQFVSLANRHIHNHRQAVGPYALPEFVPRGRGEDAEANVAAMEIAVKEGNSAACDHYFQFFLDRLGIHGALDLLLKISVPKISLDDHHLLLPIQTWRALDRVGTEYADTLIRPAVRFATRRPAPPAVTEVEELIADHGLDRNPPATNTCNDETSAVGTLASRIANLDNFNRVPGMLAGALRDGLSLRGAAEALSVASSLIFLRWRTSRASDVHHNIAANAQRHLAGLESIDPGTRLRALLHWSSGPDVKMALSQLEELNVLAARLAKPDAAGQQDLLGRIQGIFVELQQSSGPSVDNSRFDAIDRLVGFALQYADRHYEADPFFDMLARVVCRDESSEMHAYEHHQATCEEFHATRPELRGVHMLAAVKGAALSISSNVSVYEAAASLLGTEDGATIAPPARKTTTYRAPAFVDFKSEHDGRGCTTERLAHLDEHGFVIINDFVNSSWIPVLREAGRRVVRACDPDRGYSVIDCSRGYVHRARADEPWAIRGLVHPAFGEPVFAEFHGSDEFLGFVDSWCGEGLKPEDMVYNAMFLLCNPSRHEYRMSWHRDCSWWGTGASSDNEDPANYSESAERERWEEIRAENARSLKERNGVRLFLALADDECHELVPGSHNRWRTALEHDVVLPNSMKKQGVPRTSSWDGVSPLPGQVAVRLKPGQALIRFDSVLHIGHTVPERERYTLSIGWSRWSGTRSMEPIVADTRHAWQLDPAVREALPHEWMKTAWDRWARTQKLGDTLEDRYADYDIARIKSGEVVGWRTELERRAARAGKNWKPFQTVT